MVALLLSLERLCRMSQLPQEEKREQEEHSAYGEADLGSSQPIHCGRQERSSRSCLTLPAAEAEQWFK